MQDEKAEHVERLFNLHMALEHAENLEAYMRALDLERFVHSPLYLIIGLLSSDLDEEESKDNEVQTSE